MIFLYRTCTAKVNNSEETSSLDGQFSDLVEETQTLSSSPVPKVEATVLQFATLSFLDDVRAFIKCTAT